MKAESVHQLVEQLRAAESDTNRTTKATALKQAIEDMQRCIDNLEVQLKDFYDEQFKHNGSTLEDMQRSIASLEGQLKDFYDEQFKYDGATLEDYGRMVASLNEQVKSYIEDRT